MSLNLGTFETIVLAELRIGLPPLFYTRLLDITDDWAFVLKLHSFFEGTLTKLLHEKLALPANRHETMTPRDSFVSRVHLAERLGVMEPDYRAFLLALNRLRNDITHNVRFIAFELRGYVDALSDTEFRRTARALCAGFKDIPVGDYVAMLQKEQTEKHSNHAGTRIAPADREMSSRFLAAFSGPGKAKRERLPRTVREFFWLSAPKPSIWYAGVWTLDMLSLHLHSEGYPDVKAFRFDSDLEAKVQDILHDPAVLEYRHKMDGLWSAA
jgi:hypothetical protein